MTDLTMCPLPACCYVLSLYSIHCLGCATKFPLGRRTLWNVEMLIFYGEWILGLKSTSIATI
jgi:hypothetical protein